MSKEKISIDHFVPWQFVAHDELWNLSPTTKTINSSKGNKLPRWEEYYEPLALLEYKAYRICDDNPVAKAKFEECAKYHINNMDVRNSLYAEGLDDGQFPERLGNILKPVYRVGEAVWISGVVKGGKIRYLSRSIEIEMEDNTMNETLKVLETRRSCRNFDKERMVSEEDIQAVVKAGTYAATGMGRQSPIIIAVTNKELRDRLSAENAKIMGTATDPFYGAPVILIVLADKDIPTYQYDGSLVMGNLMNAAESLGLGSIWIHRAKEEFESDFGEKILADLGIEGNYEGIGHCAIGYAAAPANAPAPRKENYVYYVK